MPWVWMKVIWCKLSLFQLTPKAN